MTTERARRDFGAGLFRALASSDTRQVELAAALGVSQSTVSQWVTAKNAPDPETVFAVESHLRLPPGHLSRHLGYLPFEPKDEAFGQTMNVIAADPGLDEMGKTILLSLYRTLHKAARTRSDPRISSSEEDHPR